MQKSYGKKYYKNGITIQWPIYDKDTGQATYPYKPIKYKMLMRSPERQKRVNVFLSEIHYTMLQSNILRWIYISKCQKIMRRS